MDCNHNQIEYKPNGANVSKCLQCGKKGMLFELDQATFGRFYLSDRIKEIYLRVPNGRREDLFGEQITAEYEHE